MSATGNRVHCKREDSTKHVVPVAAKLFWMSASPLTPQLGYTWRGSYPFDRKVLKRRNFDKCKAGLRTHKQFYIFSPNRFNFGTQSQDCATPSQLNVCKNLLLLDVCEEKSVHNHHRKNSSWRTIWPHSKTVQVGGGYKKPYKNQETTSTTEIFSLWPPIFRQRKVLHWSRAVYAFFFPGMSATPYPSRGSYAFDRNEYRVDRLNYTPTSKILKV